MSSEKQTVSKLHEPNTVLSLLKAFRSMGIEKGDSLIVHSSLSSLGWVSGGAQAVVLALMETVGEEGTLVMPTQSSDLSDPMHWCAPPVPREWWQTIRDTIPAFDPHLTPTRGMGRIVEVFRSHPDVVRSSHPQHSFAAWGKNKDWMEAQPLSFGLGPDSPLQKLCDNDCKVLLLGVGFDSNTSFHLAEYRLKDPVIDVSSAPVIIDGERRWESFEDVEHYEEWFIELGIAFEKSTSVKTGKVGAATAKLFPARESVHFAREWLQVKRDNRPKDL
ncbi:AAC(3) family N-acetyltransferase [Bacillus sp. H-16]|uniref:aminoglycoside N(3)-acetyltransferase n=1 Tax=Alteribacter salitolerans TaxID=2912333 RepID=UPI001965D035|nr:AAC(3) family N-acetyltransferase [Alteribacter salitolerans]MBM7095340.1 AAC(3) family N-acetyltransferase [Alteribacter salitolerans]